MDKKQYEANKLKEKVAIPRKVKVDGKEIEIVEEIFPYLADPGLIKAVNLAILLERPLLLMGEPGCGKTRVAKAVAYELFHEMKGKDIKRDYKDYYFEWNIKSTSKAQEGLYEFDAIRRLGEAQILSARLKHGEEINVEKELDKSTFVKLGQMGEAFEKSIDPQNRPILLIDEIDKADIDFPNDLLNELDNGYFTIPETGEKVVAKVKPIVFITSNAEKDLPDAFLRRCLFHYIKPFDEEMFHRIINSRFYRVDSEDPHNDLVEAAVKQFIEIRDKIQENKMVIGKSISTSELIDWFSALKHYSETAALDKKQQASVQSLIAELNKLDKGTLEIPFQQVLFKNWNTLAAFDKF